MLRETGILSKKRIVVMGLLDTKGFAWSIGRAAAEHGAEIVFTVHNERFMNSVLRRSFKSCGLNMDDYTIIPCDVTSDSDLEALASYLGSSGTGVSSGKIDGLVHSIGSANPKTCLTGALYEAPRADIIQAFEISAASLALTVGKLESLLNYDGSIVAMTFDSQRVYPGYNWMGVCKAALEASVRYLARDLGPRAIRVNSLSAGPQNTTAASHIPGFSGIGDIWPKRAPLGWDLDHGREQVVTSALYFLSDFSRGVTGIVMPVDGGFHMMGIESPPVTSE